MANEKVESVTCIICGDKVPTNQAHNNYCIGCYGKAGEGTWHRGVSPCKDSMIIKPGDTVKINTPFSPTIRWKKAVVKVAVKGNKNNQRGFFLLEGFGKRRFTFEELKLVRGN